MKSSKSGDARGKLVARLTEIRSYVTSDSSEPIIGSCNVELGRAARTKDLAQKVAEIGTYHGLSYEGREASGFYSLERNGTVWDVRVTREDGTPTDGRSDDLFVDHLMTFLAGG